MIQVCRVPGCGEPAEPGGACAEHRRERERERSRQRRAEGDIAQKTYRSAKSQRQRAHKLFTTPICERCNEQLAVEVHHKVPLLKGGEPYAPDNLLSTCRVVTRNSMASADALARNSGARVAR
jgi:5-methylcytosine-specific restriction endonuclease McrA